MTHAQRPRDAASPVQPLNAFGPHPGTRLVIVATLSIVVLCAIGAVLARRNYESERRRVTEQTAGMARTAAAETDRLLRDRIALLQTVAAAPAVRAGDARAMEVYFTYLADRQPDLRRVIWYDRDGTPRASARAEPSGARASAAGADYFHNVLATGQPVVATARRSTLDGRVIVPIAVPTFGDDDRLNGVFEGGITDEQLRQTLDEFGVDVAATLTVVDPVNQIVADDGGDAAAPLRPAADTRLVEQARTLGGGAGGNLTDVRGVEDRLVAAATVPTGGWLLFVSRPSGEAFAPARRIFTNELVLLMSVGIVALGGAFWAGRRLDRLSAAQHRALAASEALAHENEGLYHEASEAVRLRNDFISSVSHDLKNPIASIKAHAQRLHRRAAHLDPADGAPLAEGLAEINGVTDRMTAMIDELLDVARLQIGQPLDLRLRPTDLATLTAARVDAQNARIGRRRITVDAALPELVGLWDPVRLERVLDNLLANALKYSPDGGGVTVSLRESTPHTAGDEQAHWVVLCVRDKGVGIPAADLPHVFDRFHRAANVVGQIEGTGLGLAGVRQIVEQHGGMISVDSVEGQGSTFTVRLPRSAERCDTA